MSIKIFLLLFLNVIAKPPRVDSISFAEWQSLQSNEDYIVYYLVKKLDEKRAIETLELSLQKSVCDFLPAIEDNSIPKAKYLEFIYDCKRKIKDFKLSIQSISITITPMFSDDEIKKISKDKFFTNRTTEIIKIAKIIEDLKVKLLKDVYDIYGNDLFDQAFVFYRDMKCFVDKGLCCGELQDYVHYLKVIKNPIESDLRENVEFKFLKRHLSEDEENPQVIVESLKERWLSEYSELSKKNSLIIARIKLFSGVISDFLLIEKPVEPVEQPVENRWFRGLSQLATTTVQLISETTTRFTGVASDPLVERCRKFELLLNNAKKSFTMQFTGNFMKRRV